MLSGDPDLLRRARQLLARRFGEVDAQSAAWPFDQTDYYAAEMGSGLQPLVSSASPILIRADSLAEIKLQTNALEERKSPPNDCLAAGMPAARQSSTPATSDLSKLVLATTKDRRAPHLPRPRHSSPKSRCATPTARGNRCSRGLTPTIAAPAYHEYFVERVRKRYRQQCNALGWLGDEHAVSANTPNELVRTSDDPGSPRPHAGSFLLGCRRHSALARPGDSRRAAGRLSSIDPGATQVATTTRHVPYGGGVAIFVAACAAFRRWRICRRAWLVSNVRPVVRPARRTGPPTRTSAGCRRAPHRRS